MEYYLQKKKIIKNREMRNFTFKGLFLAIVFIVLGSLSIQAADGLITKQITIKLEKAGTLPDKIGSTKKFQITNLKIIGEINGTDLRMIHEMAGNKGTNSVNSSTNGMLSVLDLSDAKIVKGGDSYYNYRLNVGSNPCYTSNDKIGDYAFFGCSRLTSITLPSGIARIGNLTFKDCSGLTSIYVCTEKLPDMGRDVFDGCDAKKCTVYIPKGTYDDYWLSEFGYFENIVEFDPTGVNNVITSNDAKELSRYSLNGQRLSAPTKGLNIVKYSDGSVKKVAIQ